jgi:hypothetical protein
MPAGLSFVMTLIVIGGGHPHDMRGIICSPRPPQRSDIPRRHRNVSGHGQQRASSGPGNRPGSCDWAAQPAVGPVRP